MAHADVIRVSQEENKRAMQTLADNRKLQEEKRISELQAREDEEKRIQYFAEEKERKMKMRAEREAEIATQKQAVRQRMIDRQVCQKSPASPVKRALHSL